jgi:hypothetical protein
METNNQPLNTGPSNFGSRPTQGNNNSSNKIPALGLALIILLIIAAAVVYYSNKQHQNLVTQPTTQKLPDHFTDNYGDTFDKKPFAGSPQDLVLTGGQVLQYFDNKSYSGVMFKVNQTFAQVKASYQAQLSGTSWSILQMGSSTPEHIFTLVNKQTKKTATVTMDSVSDTVSTVAVAVQK